MVPKKPGCQRGLERQSGRYHQPATQHDAGVDQEVEHDAEEVEPAGRLALFRNGFDAELLDAGGLTVARAQAALDVGCGRHEAILRAASRSEERRVGKEWRSGWAQCDS